MPRKKRNPTKRGWTLRDRLYCNYLLRESSPFYGKTIVMVIRIPVYFGYFKSRDPVDWPLVHCRNLYEYFKDKVNCKMIDQGVLSTYVYFPDTDCKVLFLHSRVTDYLYAKYRQPLGYEHTYLFADDGTITPGIINLSKSYSKGVTLVPRSKNNFHRMVRFTKELLGMPLLKLQNDVVSSLVIREYHPDNTVRITKTRNEYEESKKRKGDPRVDIKKEESLAKWERDQQEILSRERRENTPRTPRRYEPKAKKLHQDDRGLPW